MKEVVMVSKTEKDVLNEILEKHSYWKAILIVAWVARLLRNCRGKGATKSFPLTAEETELQVTRWIYRVQARFAKTDKYQEDGPRLNLQKNAQEIFECRGRIQGDYPVYLPDDELFSEKLVASAHEDTLHGSVDLTMAKVWERYWMPRLRRLTERVIKNCYGCKRFQTVAFAHLQTGNLPKSGPKVTISSHRSGLCWTNQIRYGRTQRRKGVHRALWLQSY